MPNCLSENAPSGVWVWQPTDTPPCKWQFGSPVSEGATHRDVTAPILPAKDKRDLVSVHRLGVGLVRVTLPSPLIKLGQVGPHCNQHGTVPTQ